MSAAPSASNSDKTFTSSPADNLSRGTNYKLQITTSAKDTSSNSLADNYTTTNGFTTYGTGTIIGTVRYDNNTAADNVSLSFAKSGTIVDNITNEDNGTYILDNLSLGTYTLTAAKINYIDATQLATLATESQTVTANFILLSNTCLAGTVSGTITDAVSGNAVSGVSLSVRSGLGVTSGSTTGITATTATNGTYTLLEADGAASSMNAGGYTVEASKIGYITIHFKVQVCGNKTGQNAPISPTMTSGTMRIVLSWPTGSTVTDLDSHLRGPDNASGRFKVYYPSNKKKFYYATNNNACTGCSTSQLSDNVTLDLDDQSAPGTETTTIAKVRDGIYRFYVHEYYGNSSSTGISTSGASVTVYYNNKPTTFNVPNSAGNLWGVFTFTLENNIGFTGSDNITAYTNANAIE